MKSYEFIKDLSTITGVPYQTLDTFFRAVEDLSCCCIKENLEENKENETCIDLDFGKLYIRVLNEKVSFKFIPSHRFEKKVKDTINGDRTALEVSLDTSIEKIIRYTYKDVLNYG